MKIEINHRGIELDGTSLTLTELLQHEGISEKGHAIAVDNNVVPRDSWSSFVVTDGMKITVIRAVCGG